MSRFPRPTRAAAGLFLLAALGGPSPAPPDESARLRLVDAATGEPVKDATVRVQVEGRTVESRAAADGRAELRVPVQSAFVLEAPRRPRLHRTLYLDYPPQRARVERLAPEPLFVLVSVERAWSLRVLLARSRCDLQRTIHADPDPTSTPREGLSAWHPPCYPYG